ncbi:MAG: hypothetical protein LBI18_06850 [Planctomycetaceae bacterium]|nr:hypothetical protein [Planctomycetaceae bacterium]
MNFLEYYLERYFMSRIDEALDHAQPLDCWTAWYVRRNPKLQDYYTAMIQLELELRFPETETNHNHGNHDNLITAVAPNHPLSHRNQNQSQKDHRNCRNRRNNGNHWTKIFRHRVWTTTATILLAILVVLPFFRGNKTRTTGTTETVRTNISNTPTEWSQNQKIDLADFVDDLFIAANPTEESTPPIDNPFVTPFDSSLTIPLSILLTIPFEIPSEKLTFPFPVEPIVRFTDCPLESTLILLETAGIVRSSHHERDQ